MVNPDHQSVPSPVGQRLDPDPRPTPELDDPVGASNIQYVHRPTNSPNIRLPMPHHPTGDVARRTGGPMKLLHDPCEQTLSESRTEVHGNS